ncbi:MAG: tRNA pseudouridine synthase A [Bacteroidota bacterium]
MRYFMELAYNGANYCGWQRQPSSPSVQETLETAFATILRTPGFEITGCGRTDTGVHASQYFAHFIFREDFPRNFLSRVNKFLPKDIVIRRILPMRADQHARFDAFYRAYAYHLTWAKDPFRQKTVTHFARVQQFNQTLMQEAAHLLLDFDHFLPFCKTGSDAKTMHCEMHRSEWEFRPTEWVYHVAANRFLRGMVRLIVGMCLSVGEGKLKLIEVRRALEKQERLPRSLSAPPEGLFLAEIRYPYPLESPNAHQ